MGSGTPQTGRDRVGVYEDPQRPAAQELQVNAMNGFTLAAVGDCILSRPVSQLARRDDRFSAVLELLKRSDVACGNLETTILDHRGDLAGHPYPWEGDWTLSAEPAVAEDLAVMALRLLSRANNHALDWGPEGMRSTGRLLDAAGIVHAGSGRHEQEARGARYLETPGGRVGLVSLATTYRPFSDALPQGRTAGRPGVSAVALAREHVLPQADLERLAELARSVGAPVETRGRTLRLFDQAFTSGSGARHHYRYAPDPDHVRATLQAIRLGKLHSDLLVATLHSHEPADTSLPQHASHAVRDLAHAAVDAGADVFITTGIHHLGPVEVYRGRPVFHGLGNFFWSDLQEPLPEELYRINSGILEEALEDPESATDADLSRILNAQSFANSWTFESVVAECRFNEGALEEVLLHPVELGYGEPLTRSGIPRLAGPGKGQEIIERVAALSRPFGTTVEWSGSYGRVRF